MPLLNIPKPHITRRAGKLFHGAPQWFKCQGVHGIAGWGYSPKLAYDHWRASMEGRVYRHHDHEPELCQANYRRKRWSPNWSYQHANPKE